MAFLCGEGLYFYYQIGRLVVDAPDAESLQPDSHDAHVPFLKEFHSRHARWPLPDGGLTSCLSPFSP